MKNDNDIEPETFAAGCFIGILLSVIIVLLVAEFIHLLLSIW